MMPRLYCYPDGEQRGTFSCSEKNLLTDLETRFQQMVSEIKDYAIFMLDVNGNITTWNKGAELLTGYDTSDVMGKNISILYPEETNYPKLELSLVVSTGRFEDEGWQIRKDGTKFWARIIITAIHDENGQVIGFTEFSHDISDSKAQMEKLRQSEQRFRLLIDVVRDYAIFMLDPDGNILTWNSGAERLVGYTAFEIIGKHFSLFYPEETCNMDFPRLELETSQRLGQFEDETWRVRKDGSRFWANIVITAIHNTEGQLMGFAQIIRDLTELNTQKKALRRSEERLRLVVENIKDYAIFMSDIAGNILSWNKGAERLTGYNDVEALGKSFSIFYPQESLAQSFPKYELFIAQRDGKFENEGWRIRKDGSRFWANVIISTIHADGQLLGFSNVIRDLSETQATHEQILGYQQRIHKHTQELEDFISIASHDLQEPARKILLFTDFLKKEYETKPDDPQVADYVNRVQNATLRLQEYINDLLELSRILRKGKPFRAVDLQEVIREVLTNLKSLIMKEEAQISFTGEFPEFEADYHQMSQLFSSLIHNAIKFHRADIPPQIEIFAQQGTMEISEIPVPYIEISITDKGIGFDESYIDKIFQPFGRLQGKSVSGTGMGLALCKKIVERHHGTIQVTSRIGEGSTFTLRLPLKQVS